MSSAFVVEIDFANTKNEVFTLKWNVLNRDYAWIWIQELKKLMRKEEPLFARFTGFRLEEDEKKKIFDQLNKAIDIINAEGLYKIEERGKGYFDQDFANVIHHHFEVLYGDAHSPSEVYLNSSPLVQSAITRLNHCVHDLESLYRNEENKDAFSAVIVEFLERQQFRLSPEMLNDFSMDIDFGDLVLHYGIIGKTWWEVFLDKDEEIFESAIRPLDVLSGEFDIHFGHQKIDVDTKDEFFRFLKAYGKDPNDPGLALGHLCLGKLDSKLSAQEIKKKVSLHNKLHEIRIFKKENCEASYFVGDGHSTHNGFFQIQEEQVLIEGKSIKLLNIPIQLIPLKAKTEVALLESPFFYSESEKSFFKQRRGHIISLMGQNDEYPIRVTPSEKPGGIRLNREVILKKGDLLHLAFDGEAGYLPIRAKGLKDAKKG